MSTDMLIGVGVRADFSSLKTESKASAEAVRQAEANWKEAFDQLGKSAEQGNEQAIAALKGYEQELAQARARAAEASREFAALGTGVAHTVPQFAAASGAVRLLEGGMNNNVRAAERFLSTTLGLGPVLIAAFPAVGAIALAEVIARGIGRLVEFGKDAAVLSRQLGIGWLDAAIGEMDGLAAAAKQADGEIDNLAKDMDNLTKKGQELDIEHIRLTEGPKAAFEAQIAQQEKFIKSQQALLPLLAEERKQAAEAAIPERRTDPKSGVQSTVTTEANIRAQLRLKEIDKQYSDIAAHVENAQREIRNFNDEIAKTNQKDTAKQEKQDLRDATRAAKEHGEAILQMARDNDEALKEEQNATDELNALGEKQIAEERKDMEERERYAREYNDRRARESFEAQEKEAQAAFESANAQIEAAAKVAEARIEYMLASAAISQEAAAHDLAAIKAKQYTDQIAALNRELTELKRIEGEGGDTGDKQRQIQTKITTLGGDRDAAMATGAANQAKQFERPWVNAFDTISRQWMNIQDEMLRGQISIATGMKRMASDMLMDVVHSYEQIILAALRRKVLEVAAHTSAEAQKTAATGVGAATREAIETGATLKSIARSAASAAAGAWNALSSIPIVGPILGAAAAAATYAGVLAFGGAFEKGGVVGGSLGSAIPIVAHAGERVLTASQTATFDRVMSAPVTRSSASSVTNHFGGNTFNGVADSKTFSKMLQQHSRDVAKSTRRAIRNGNFRPA